MDSVTDKSDMKNTIIKDENDIYIYRFHLDLHD